MGIHFSKERENFETFKTYMFIKLLNQNKTKDDFFKNQIMKKNQIMVNVYLWIILS
jgi:hypothetical protein